MKTTKTSIRHQLSVLRTERQPNLWYSFRALTYFLMVSAIGLALVSCGEKKAETPIAPPIKDVAIGQIVAIGRVEPEAKLTTLASEVGGLINEIKVKAGDTVRKGQVILTLSQDVEQAQLALAEARINTSSKEIATQQAQVASARIKLNNLTQKLPRLQALLAQGAETQQNVDNLIADIDQSAKEIERIQATSNATLAKIAELRADVNVSRKQLAKRTVLAPADGEVLNMDLTPGSMLSAGTAICDFAPKSALTVLVEVDELFTNRVFLGQKALLRTQGQADTLAFGEVIYAAPALKKKSIFSDESSNLEDRRVREVRIKITSPNTLLYNSRVEVILFVKDGPKATVQDSTTASTTKN